MKKEFNFEKNFIIVQGWMLTDTDLTGNELLTYALIYDLTQWSQYVNEQKETCSFSYDYLSGLLHVSKQAAINLIQRLADKKYIKVLGTSLKDEKSTRNKYKILSYSKVEASYRRGQQTSLLRGQETLPPKDNKKDIKKINYIKEKELESHKLENKPIAELTEQELEILKQDYEKKLQMIIAVAKGKWIDD